IKVDGCWLLVVGCWLLVVGCWLLVVGCWLLVVGCWLLVVSFYTYLLFVKYSTECFIVLFFCQYLFTILLNFFQILVYGIAHNVGIKRSRQRSA
ncbi:MAG: hypothetical protein LBU39_05070, partial [Desulfobulbaceae bacterium]|nr:hypothetical protein [Desulfobulbaceae bacterium]